MADLVKLSVLGITYSQVQSGAYALVLKEENGNYRIPIVVGVNDAQAIAMKLEGILPPRPVMADVTTSLLHAYGINLESILIYDFADGVFKSELRFLDQDKAVTVDARTSDAIALALRTGAPIYTTRHIVEVTGFLPKDTEQPEDEQATNSEQPAQTSRGAALERLSLAQLEKLMARHVDREEYEQAARIKEIIAKREQQRNTPDQQ